MSAPELMVCIGCCLDVGGDAVLAVATENGHRVAVREEECLDVCGDQPAIGVGTRRALVSNPAAVVGVIDTLEAGGRVDLSVSGLREVDPT